MATQRHASMVTYATILTFYGAVYACCDVMFTGALNRTNNFQVSRDYIRH